MKLFMTPRRTRDKYLEKYHQEGRAQSKKKKIRNDTINGLIFELTFVVGVSYTLYVQLYKIKQRLSFCMGQKNLSFSLKATYGLFHSLELPAENQLTKSRHCITFNNQKVLMPPVKVPLGTKTNKLKMVFIKVISGFL